MAVAFATLSIVALECVVHSCLYELLLVGRPDYPDSSCQSTNGVIVAGLVVYAHDVASIYKYRSTFIYTTHNNLARIDRNI